MSKIKVLLADDHKLLRNGIKAILNSDKSIEVVGEASNGTEAVDLSEKIDYDVILMDLSMPELDGKEATEIIIKRNPDSKIIGLTMHGSQETIMEMVKAGAIGYVMKDADPSELIEAVNHASEGQKFYSSDVANTIINAMMGKGGKTGGSELVLNEREKEILKYISQGNTNKEIGDLVYLSPRTVDTYRRKLIEKFDARNTAELVTKAHKANMID